jgi:hypothetical protein
MNHLMDFDPYMIGKHNQQMHTEITSLRLQERLRKNRGDGKSVADGLGPRRWAGWERVAGMAPFSKAS